MKQVVFSFEVIQGRRFWYESKACLDQIADVQPEPGAGDAIVRLHPQFFCGFPPPVWHDATNINIIVTVNNVDRNA